MKIRNAALIGAVMVGVAACSPNAPEQTEVSGARDDIKKVAAVKEVSHKVKKTKQECSRRKDGVCKSWRTVPDGYKKVVDKAGKPALYCVELDDVNGSAKDDDVWYTTSAATYLKAASLSEGDAIKFMPVHGGCW